MSAKNKPVSMPMNKHFEANYDRIFSKGTPIGEDTRPKDRIKQGISSSTTIEEWDCTESKDSISFVIEVEGKVTRFITVQAPDLDFADALAVEEFCNLTGADEASVVR